MNPRENIKVAIQSLGCKVNQYEALKVGAQFSRAGYKLCGPEEEADVYIVNTCTVTGSADRTSRKLARRAARKNGRALVVVTGCHAAAWDEALDGVKVLKIAQTEKESLYARVEETLFGVTPDVPQDLAYHTVLPISNRTKAYLKIQDGCDRFCTYCIIPFIRGRSRSRPADEILNEARFLMQSHEEIVITGICVGDYGRDFERRDTLADLLEKLLALPYIGRIRVSSIDPCDMNEKLVALTADHPRFCRHLHLALQHGSDRILKRMGRDYTSGDFLALCRDLKSRNPFVAITTDIIVGFPGEKEEDFQATMSLARESRFSKIHVFPYSERSGTGAVKLRDKVPAEVRDRRARELIRLSESLTREFHEACIGREEEALVEHERDRETGLLQGYTSNYIPVLLDGGDEWMGRTIRVKLEAHRGGKMAATAMEPARG